MESAFIRTKLGTFRVAWTERGISTVDFPASTPPSTAKSGAKLPARLRAEFAAYTGGRAIRWTVPLDWQQGTEFQREVWRAMCQIPYGETRSYAWIAQRIGRPKATRAVGAACGANPIPVIIPCHRVVASDGSLGGFSSGLDWKRKLLRLEGVAV